MSELKQSRSNALKLAAEAITLGASQNQVSCWFSYINALAPSDLPNFARQMLAHTSQIR